MNELQIRLKLIYYINPSLVEFSAFGFAKYTYLEEVLPLAASNY